MGEHPTFFDCCEPLFCGSITIYAANVKDADTRMQELGMRMIFVGILFAGMLAISTSSAQLSERTAIHHDDMTTHSVPSQTHVVTNEMPPSTTTSVPDVEHRGADSMHSSDASMRVDVLPFEEE